MTRRTPALIIEIATQEQLERCSYEVQSLLARMSGGEPATVARLTAERDEARAEAAAAYEKAAQKADSYRDSCTPGGMQAICDTLGCSIRALATEPGTTALAEMLDAEARACAEICEKQAQTFSTEEYAVGQPLSSISERFACSQIKAAILARIDQRKEAGE